MNKNEIVVGQHYAVREKNSPDAIVHRVKITAHIRRNKWKAEWVEPNTGLVDYVESAHILAPWKGRKAFLEEETSRARILEYCASHGYAGDSPIVRAVEQVFDSCGETISFSRGVLSGAPESLERIKARAEYRMSDPIVAYTDRAGQRHLPFDVALALAKAFCSREPATVLVDVEATEQDWSTKAGRPGEHYMLKLLNEYRASWAILRQWTGSDPAIAAREERIRKLERLVYDAIYALQKAGLDDESGRLRRAVERI